MQSGTLTVMGTDSTLIILSGQPRTVEVHFKPEHHPVPCRPHHQDHLRWTLVSEDEKFHHHHHHQFFLSIEWEVDGLREIEWIVLY